MGIWNWWWYLMLENITVTIPASCFLNTGYLLSVSFRFQRKKSSCSLRRRATEAWFPFIICPFFFFHMSQWQKFFLGTWQHMLLLVQSYICGDFPHIQAWYNVIVLAEHVTLFYNLVWFCNYLGFECLLFYPSSSTCQTCRKEITLKLLLFELNSLKGGERQEDLLDERKDHSAI